LLSFAQKYRSRPPQGGLFFLLTVLIASAPAALQLN